MTEQDTPQYTPYYTGTQPATPAPKKKRTGLKIAGGVLAGLLIFGAGAGSTSAQTVEVEKRVEVPGPERVRTVEKKVETTPAVCLQAITLSEEAFDIAAAALGHVQTRNVAGINAETAKLNTLAPSLNAAKAACRAK